jgi:hypothetical protein
VHHGAHTVGAPYLSVDRDRTMPYRLGQSLSVPYFFDHDFFVKAHTLPRFYMKKHLKQIFKRYMLRAYNNI